jgi:hypothetical protein
MHAVQARAIPRFDDGADGHELVSDDHGKVRYIPTQPETVQLRVEHEFSDRDTERCIDIFCCCCGCPPVDVTRGCGEQARDPIGDHGATDNNHARLRPEWGLEHRRERLEQWRCALATDHGQTGARHPGDEGRDHALRCGIHIPQNHSRSVNSKLHARGVAPHEWNPRIDVHHHGKHRGSTAQRARERSTGLGG